MSALNKRAKVCCSVAFAMALVATLTARAEEALVLYRSGNPATLHVVSLDGTVTPLRTLNLSDEPDYSLVDTVDGQFAFLWVERSGPVGMMRGRLSTTDIEQTFPVKRDRDGQAGRFSLQMRDLALDPQARRLAYIDESKGQSLCVKDLSGPGGLRTLLDSDEWLMSPSWSPDGSRIAVFQGKKGGSVPFLYRLLVVDAQTGQAKGVAPYSKSGGIWMDGSISPPAWRPNGKAIFFRAYYEERDRPRATKGLIYAVSPDGGPVVRMAEGYMPMVHPDGDRLYCRRSGQYRGGAGTVVYDLAQDTEVLREGLYLKKVSPSGKYLACERHQEDDEPYTGTTITLTDKDGQIVKTIETGQDIGWIVGWTEE